jgi:hypothetical protein
LFAVTTDFFAASAAAMAAWRIALPADQLDEDVDLTIGCKRDGISGPAQRRDQCRFLLRERAVTATTSIGRPQAASASRWRSIMRTTDAPTVPKPAIPSFNGEP